MNIRTSNTILYCKRWHETVAFYREALSLEISYSNDWFVEFKLNAKSRLSIADEARSSVKSSRGRGITIALEVDDIEETLSYLRNAGLNPDDIKRHPWNALVIHIYDPEGNRLEFWSEIDGKQNV